MREVRLVEFAQRVCLCEPLPWSLSCSSVAPVGHAPAYQSLSSGRMTKLKSPRTQLAASAAGGRERTAFSKYTAGIEPHHLRGGTGPRCRAGPSGCRCPKIAARPSSTSCHTGSRVGRRDCSHPHWTQIETPAWRCEQWLYQRRSPSCGFSNELDIVLWVSWRTRIWCFQARRTASPHLSWWRVMSTEKRACEFHVQMRRGPVYGMAWSAEEWISMVS
jgi:hypothetical protein